jgi:hypothetical protein
MVDFIKNKIFIIVLAIIFEFSLVTKVMAVACENFNAQPTCDAQTICEWCQMSGQSASCHKKLETNWPPSPAGTKLSRCSSLPDLVKYFYEWGLTIGGILTFFSLIIGGVLYLSSAGNPGTMKEAKDRIFSALLGLILLFSCWLILNVINPELTTFKSGPLNLSGVEFFECDTDADCVQIYGVKDYKCNEPDSTKGDGTKAGLCVRKESEEEKQLFAMVFSKKGFNGTTTIAKIDEATDVQAGSVLTYYFRHEIGLQDNCSTNCSLCLNQADCNARFTDIESYACYWVADETNCYTDCEKNACGSILQLFSISGCGDKIGDVNAYDPNLARWVDKEINCVRLIIPSY